MAKLSLTKLPQVDICFSPVLVWVLQKLFQQVWMSKLLLREPETD